MILGLSTIRNEADIVAASILHLLEQGVDRIVVSEGRSTDETDMILYAIAADYPNRLIVEDDPFPFHFQPLLMNEMMERHAQPGDWIIPFDADEFWYSPEYDTIAEALNRLPDEVRVLHVPAWQHRDWDHRETQYRSLGKCAFRYEPGARIANGNHSVNLGGGVSGVLELRELQFRSFEHLKRKCRERVDRIDPSLPETEGTHQRRLAAMSEAELAAEWERLQSASVVWDPIPCSSPARH